MLNRERIIVIIMIIVVIFGAYSFFSQPEESALVAGSQKRIADLKQFVVQAATNLSQEYISAADQYIIEQAEKRIPKNPFLQTGAVLASQPFEIKTEVATQKVQLAYTGFIQTPKKLIAIINGLEYETGEQLNEAGYYVKKISPRNVVIGMGKNKENIVLPLDESVGISLEAKE
jgi:hypothetical protein